MLIEMGERLHSFATAIASVADRGRREGLDVWCTGSFVARGAGIANRTGRWALGQIVSLLERLGEVARPRKGWLRMNTSQWSQIELAYEDLVRRGLIPELPGDLAMGESVPAVLPQHGSTMACPYHDDRHPSAWFTYAWGNGGGLCLACGARFALREEDGQIVAKRSTKDLEVSEISAIATREGKEIEEGQGTAPRGEGIEPRGRHWRVTHHHVPAGPVRGATGRLGGTGHRRAERWHARQSQPLYGRLAPPTAHATSSQLISVGIGVGIRWDLRGLIPRPGGFHSAATRRIVFDLDDLDERIAGISPEALDRIRALGAFDVIETSPTGLHCVLDLGRFLPWREILAQRSWLRTMGQQLLDALGRGGRVDEGMWRSGAMTRLPGWRTLTKGRWAGLRWYVEQHVAI